MMVSMYGSFKKGRSFGPQVRLILHLGRISRSKKPLACIRVLGLGFFLVFVRVSSSPFFLKGDGRFLWVYEGLGARARAFRVDWFRAPRDLWEVPTLGAWMQDEKCRFQACRADKWFRTTPYIRTYCLIAVPLTIRSLQKFQCRLSI